MNDKIILAIDLGTKKSAYVYLYGLKILEAGYTQNDILLYKVQGGNYDALAVEGVRSFGPSKKIGNTTLITCEWAGIFYQAARSRGKTADILYSKTLSKNGCRSIRGYFGNKKRIEISRIVKEMIPGCFGNKKNPGLLYMHSDIGKNDHKLCAASVGIVFQGSEQYRRMCQ